MHAIEKEQNKISANVIVSKLMETINTVAKEMILNETFICQTPNITVKRLIELTEKQMQLGNVHTYLQNIIQTRFKPVEEKAESAIIQP
jgi:hypothetical protein